MLNKPLLLPTRNRSFVQIRRNLDEWALIAYFSGAMAVVKFLAFLEAKGGHAKMLKNTQTDRRRRKEFASLILDG